MPIRFTAILASLIIASSVNADVYWGPSGTCCNAWCDGNSVLPTEGNAAVGDIVLLSSDTGICNNSILYFAVTTPTQRMKITAIGGAGCLHLNAGQSDIIAGCGTSVFIVGETIVLNGGTYEASVDSGGIIMMEVLADEVEEPEIGTCCLDTGCTFITADQCSAAGGSWLTFPSSCLDCSDPCTGDSDGDGIVGFNDILLILNQWGPCSG